MSSESKNANSEEVKNKINDIHDEFVELLKKEQLSDEKIQRILNILYR